MKGESISGILFSLDPSFQKEGNGIRSPTRNPDDLFFLIDDSALHNEFDPLELGDVLEGIAVHGDEIGI
jgi:hypothetical protein